MLLLYNYSTKQLKKYSTIKWTITYVVHATSNSTQNVGTMFPLMIVTCHDTSCTQTITCRPLCKPPSNQHNTTTWPLWPHQTSKDMFKALDNNWLYSPDIFPELLPWRALLFKGVLTTGRLECTILIYLQLKNQPKNPMPNLCNLRAVLCWIIWQASRKSSQSPVKKEGYTSNSFTEIVFPDRNSGKEKKRYNSTVWPPIIKRAILLIDK